MLLTISFCQHLLFFPRHLASPTGITGCRIEIQLGYNLLLVQKNKPHFHLYFADNLLGMEAILFRHIPGALGHINKTVGGLEDCNPLSIVLQRVACIGIMLHIYYLLRNTQNTDKVSYFSCRQNLIKVSNVTFTVQNFNEV